MNVIGFLIVMAILHAVSFGMIASKHGQPREGKENVWVTLTAIGIFWGLAWLFGLI